MNETPLSLLDRLARRADSLAWQEFVDLYTPCIRSWLRRDAQLGTDADDLVQEVLGVVVRELASFERERQGAFRAWLRTITVNRLRAHWKGRADQPREAADALLASLEDPTSELSQRWDREHDQHVVHRLLERIAPDFEPATVRAFRLQALEGRSGADVAAELGMSHAAVLKARSRVLARLREIGRGLLD